MKKITLLIIALSILGSCEENYILVSRGSTVPIELQELSSKEIETYYTQRYESNKFATISTLIDFSYIRALRHEQKLTKEKAKEAFDSYIKKQTTFYIYLYLLNAPLCPENYEKIKNNPTFAIYDISRWDFTLLILPKQEIKKPFKIKPVIIKAIDDHSCVIGGYIHFPGSLKPTHKSIKLNIRSPNNKYIATLNWKIKVVSKKSRKE